MISPATVAPHIDEAAWLERRRGLMTASSAAAVFGEHPFITPEQLQAEKLGLLPERGMTVPMERGRIFEDLAVQRFVEKEQREVELIGLRVHPEHPLIAATADRKLIEDIEHPPGVLEVKVPMWRTFAQIKRNGLPPYMIVQAKLEAAVWGFDETTMAVWDTQSLELLTFPVPADPQLTADMIGQLEAWWERHIVNREPIEETKPLEDLPAVKGMVTHRSDRLFEDAVRDYLEARDVEKEAKEIKTEASARLKKVLDEIGVYEGGGGRVYFQQMNGNNQHAQTIKAIQAQKPIDPMKLQVALVQKLEGYPGIREFDVVEILASIAEEVRLDIDDLAVKGNPYKKLQVYRVRDDEGAF